jgi:hypothetical protein
MIVPIAVHGEDVSVEDALAARQEMALQLSIQADQLLEKYAIPFAELDNLLPLIAKNDSSGLAAKLSDFDLKEQDVSSLSVELGPLIEQGLSANTIQESLAKLATDQMKEANIKPDDYGKVMQAMTGVTDFEATFKAIGLADTELADFTQLADDLHQLGLGADDFEHGIQVEALLQTLNETKIPQNEWDAIVTAASTSPEALTAQLNTAGVDPELFIESYQEATQATYARYGFDNAAMEAFQSMALVEEIVNTEGDAEALAAVGDEFGLAEDEVTALVNSGGDPDAFIAALETLGYSSDQVTTAKKSLVDAMNPSGKNLFAVGTDG